MKEFVLTTIHTNEVQIIDIVFHFTQVKWHPFIWIFASFSEVPSCTLVSVFDNLLEHIFNNKVSKRINFILDGFCSTNWSSLVCLRLRARVLDSGGQVANHTQIFSCKQASGRKIITVMLREVFAITFFPTADSQFIVYTCGLVSDNRKGSSHFSGDNWLSTESSLSMISSSLELSSKSDQLVSFSQRLLQHPVAFLQSSFASDPLRRLRVKLSRPIAVLNRKSVLLWISNFRTTGSSLRQKPLGRHRSVSTPGNVEVVRQTVLPSPMRFAQKRAFALRLSDCAVKQCLHYDIKFVITK